MKFNCISCRIYRKLSIVTCPILCTALIRMRISVLCFSPTLLRIFFSFFATYIHLRVKLLGWWAGVICPCHVVLAKVVGAVFRVPCIVTACPWQSAAKWWVEVEQCPCDDGVVVEGDVQCDDADGETDAWENQLKALEPDFSWTVCVFTMSQLFVTG